MMEKFKKEKHESDGKTDCCRTLQYECETLEINDHDYVTSVVHVFKCSDVHVFTDMF